MTEDETPDIDLDALDAAVDLIGRTGATQFEFSFTEDPIQWWAKARYGGQIMAKEGYPDPLSAIEALARSLFGGGRCTHCLRPASLSAGEGVCHYERHGNRYVRDCEPEYPDGGPVSTKRRLATELIKRGAPAQMINNALDGRYDDYGPHPEMNIHLLVDHARKAGMNDLADMAIAGEFDATKEESDAWAASPEGQALMAELGPMAEKFFDEKVARAGKPKENRAARRRAERFRRKGHY